MISHGTAIVEKPRSKARTFNSSLPLVNPETLFSRGVWVETLNFISDYLQAAMKINNLKKDVAVCFRDLYFAKNYEKFNLGEMGKNFSEIGFGCEEFVREHHGRDDEVGIYLSVDGEKKFILKKFRGDICFSAGNSVRGDDACVKKGMFRHAEVHWKTDVEGFMKFIEAVHRALAGSGEPQDCRVYMTVTLEHVAIDVGCHFHPILPESEMRLWKDHGPLMRKVTPSRFAISFF